MTLYDKTIYFDVKYYQGGCTTHPVWIIETLSPAHLPVRQLRGLGYIIGNTLTDTLTSYRIPS